MKVEKKGGDWEWCKWSSSDRRIHLFPSSASTLASQICLNYSIIFLRALFPLASQICFKWNYSINLDFLLFWELCFHICVKDLFQISIKFDFLVFFLLHISLKCQFKFKFLGNNSPELGFLFEKNVNFCCFLAALAALYLPTWFSQSFTIFNSYQP